MSWLIVLTNKLKAFLQPRTAAHDDAESVKTLCESESSSYNDGHMIESMSRESDATLPVDSASFIFLTNGPIDSSSNSYYPQIRRKPSRKGSKSNTLRLPQRRESHATLRMEYESPEFLTSEARRKRNNLSPVEDEGYYWLLVQQSESVLNEMQMKIPYMAGCCY